MIKPQNSRLTNAIVELRGRSTGEFRARSTVPKPIKQPLPTRDRSSSEYRRVAQDNLSAAREAAARALFQRYGIQGGGGPRAGQMQIGPRIDNPNYRRNNPNVRYNTGAGRRV